MDLGPLSLLFALGCRVLGAEVAYLRNGLKSRLAQEIALRFDISQIDVENVEWIEDGSILTTEAALRGVQLLRDPMTTRFATYLGDQVSGRPGIPRALEVQLTCQITSRADDIGIIEVWTQSRHYRSKVILSSSKWDKYLIRRERRSFSTPSINTLDTAVSLSAACISTITRRVTAERLNSSVATRPESSAHIHDGQTGARVLFIPHQGIDYGNLYRWDHLFSSEVGSPLNIKNIVSLAYDSSVSDKFMSSEFFITVGIREKIGKTLRYFLRSLPKARTMLHLRILWQLARNSASARAIGDDVRQRFPNASVAILAYDMVVPTAISVGLLASGLRTFATQERPAATLQLSLPKIVDTYFTASALFSQMALRSPAAYVREATPLGMWRTDLLHKARLETPPVAIAQARARGQKSIVVLPYHVNAEKKDSLNSLVLSWSAFRHFMGDVLYLADHSPGVSFLIRGKNSDWWSHQEFSDIKLQVGLRSNVLLDDNYEELHHSYRLCAHADAVLAKHTSLAEECLALDIPTILHDYTHNTSSIAAPMFPYLPARLWAHSRPELEKRIADTLKDEGRNFSDWWKKKRPAIYGTGNDGHVSARARAIIEDAIRKDLH